MTQSIRAARPCALCISLIFLGSACFSSTENPSSTTGGTSGAGGSAGGGAKQELIDDMEDGDGSIVTASGRIGAWYSYNDASTTGMQKPQAMTPFMMETGGRDGKGFAAATSGAGFTVWGAGFG